MDSARQTLASANVHLMLKRFLYRSRTLLRTAQLARACWVLGPARGPMTLLYQKTSRKKPMPLARTACGGDLDAADTVRRLRSDGFSPGPLISPGQVEQIGREFAEMAGPKFYDAHRVSQTVWDIAHDAAIVGIARDYLGTEPILRGTCVYWKKPDIESDSASKAVTANAPMHRYDENSFHYDIIDYRSLSLFVYLTDVDQDCAPHSVILRTHRDGSAGKLLHLILSDEQADRQYGDRLHQILGQRGTGFFEETSAYHKVGVCKKARMMLKIDYVLQRQPPPVTATATRVLH